MRWRRAVDDADRHPDLHPDLHRDLRRARRLLEGLPSGLAHLPVGVVVRSGEGRHDLARRLLRGHRVVPLRPAQLGTDLVEHGPFAALVDLEGDVRWRRRLAGSWFHVARGGRYVQSLRSEQLDDVTELARDLTVGAVERHTGEAQGFGRIAAQRRALLESIAEPQVDDGLLVATQRADVLLMLGDDEHDAVAARRGLSFELLEERPATTYTSAGSISLNRAHPLNGLATTVAAPAARLRVHHDVVCLPRQAVVQDSVLLPASFSRPQRERRRTVALASAGPGFAHRPDVDATPLPGVYYHLDNETPHHFGHTITEVLGRTWGWEAARAAHPGIRALLVDMPPGTPAPWWHDLVGSAGIDVDDLVLVEGPVRVERLVTASPLYSIGEYAHPGLREVYDRVGARLEAAAGPDRRPDRVFFTRLQSRRSCSNRDWVEDLFRAHGFTVLRPERMTVAEQVATVRQAEVVAGFAGSNLLHLGMPSTSKRVVVLTSETYDVPDIHLLSVLRGHDLTMVVCPPDKPRPAGGYAGGAEEATWTVRPDVEGRYLAEVLAALG